MTKNPLYNPGICFMDKIRSVIFKLLLSLNRIIFTVSKNAFICERHLDNYLSSKNTNDLLAWA